MKQTSAYKIPFKGLKLGKHQFEYLIEKKFFESYQYTDFLDNTIEIIVDFEKQATIFELHFTMHGTVRINCDVSGEEFDQPIEGSLKLIVKFGEVYNNENEQILIIPHNDYELDISQYIYEMIILNVPVKRIHPEVLTGKLKPAIDKLEELQHKEEEQIVDPRWDKLKGLIKE